MAGTVAPGASDEEIITSFPRYQGPGIPGFIIDFLGTKTRTAYLNVMNDWEQGGLVEDYPITENFHSSGMEWAGSLRSVLEAKAQLVVMELGAGWGPWLVALARAARLRGIDNIHLVGVEGSKGHFEYLLTHFADNGLDPQGHTLLHAVVGPTDGIAEFPVLPDPSANYGARAIFSKQTNSALEHSETEKVSCVSLLTLARAFDRVDLIHFDIQGAEADVILSSLGVLKEKARRLVIGTHSRSIEQQLLDGLAAQAWVLEAEKSCTYRQDGPAMALDLDGCQVWRNPDIDFGPVYRPGTRIDFTKASSRPHLHRAWHGPEPWGQWSGRDAQVKFTLQQPQPLRLRLLATTYKAQPILVRFNKRDVTVLESHGEDAELFELDLPPDVVAETNTLHLVMPEAKSPASLGEGDDNRPLGVGIVWMEFVPVIAARIFSV
jgi:FkbM family methyltransferase